MSRKLLPADFIDIIAQSQGITKKKSEAFIRAFFEVIEEGLRNDSFVKIKGFGTFKLVSVSERESVNISTGERFQISGHTKVSFLPDNALKELVNRPFSHFETCIIPDATTSEELEAIDQTETLDEPETHQEQEPIIADEPLVDAVPTTALEVPRANEDAETTEVSNEKVETTTEPSPVQVEITEAQTVYQEQPEVEEDVEIQEEIATQEHTPETEIITEESQDVADQTNSEPMSVIETEGNITEPSELEASQTDDTEDVQDEDTTFSSSEDYEMYHHHKRNKSRWIFIGITWLITIVISYLAGYHKVIPLDHKFHGVYIQPSPIPKAVVKKATPTDTIKQTTDSATTAPPKSLLPAGADTLSVIRGIDRETANKLAEGQKQVRVGSFLIIGTYATHILRPGDTLYQIARKTYGHKDYAKYIVVYNNLTPPYNLPLGAELLLPQLVEKEEFADPPTKE